MQEAAIPPEPMSVEPLETSYGLGDLGLEMKTVKVVGSRINVY